MTSPKSNREPEIGSPSTSTCRSGRCQPRGRISIVAISSFSRYDFSGVSSEIVRRTASETLRCPSTTFVHVGEFASSKSAMKTRAPELNALIIIFRSTGPVISQRRSCRSGGRRRDAPVAFPDVPRLRQEARQRAGVELELARVAPLEQLLPCRVQFAMEAPDEVERLPGQDRVVRGNDDLDAARDFGQATAW